MAYSMKRDGKEVGPASVYAEPHTMDGKKMKISSNPGKDPNRSKLDTSDISVGQYSKSAGDEQTKTTGIKMRGTGCATKGTMSRGPMA
ncbi:hypothetical protein UFOVP1276_75 [uncultured Caudovirales phage]|uniref:Uncharacterized protein n=1 Tax=uncultured Caudovirales phage TaxID=2100421 RepID=A0A6J5S8X5_9CAUD|nr:hypothetical protein UFOVP875_17 [uncultured Caudovirales phage]CAB4195163.1 hypothetical protein UFOVP1276_75 [uncultured Caudovirales phage]CAB4205369.1 hypothetical protein UFOVP1403_79 [uncultured Caudovirales phage]CAB5238127.1 hypothetical protein UFOVP1507_63 [uncultured Caudovirales phage]